MHDVPTCYVYSLMRFNLRVYGIIIVDHKVLVSDELIRNRPITKFPGGGLELGEGTIDGLKREFKEEMGLDIEIIRHFYTTDFYVPSAFDNSQVISIYYLVQPISPMTHVINQIPNHFVDGKRQSFRWIALNDLSEDDFSLIIDKHVGSLLTKDLFLL